MKYSEEELQYLKKLSEEVFVISHKPQLPLVQKMKQNPCDVLSNGFTKVIGDFYYCKSYSHPRPIVILASPKFGARLTVVILAPKIFKNEELIFI